jgi:methyltransferase (TIGR00027 family)
MTGERHPRSLARVGKRRPPSCEHERVRDTVARVRTTQASKTASWVAAARTFGDFLPSDCRLCQDPYGVKFADPWLQTMERAARQQPGLARRLLLRGGPATRTVFYMQLRTRFIDDQLALFTRAHLGTQVVLLGAGYDCRALRLEHELGGAVFYEVDHPATQAIKRHVLAGVGGTPLSRFVPWDFENQPMTALTDALAALGHDASRPTVTIWEGVTMYLHPPAIEASFAAVRSYSAPGSRIVFTYFDKERRFERPSLRGRALSRLVESVGEPFRFGWSPAGLPTWLFARGFELREDMEDAELSLRLLPKQHQRWVSRDGRRIAVAERSVGG